MTIRSRMTVPALTMVLVGALATACTAGDAEPQDTSQPSASSAPAGGLDKLYEEALKEGVVTWYSSAPADTPEAFEAAYPGITVDFIRLPAGQLGTRYAQERGAGATPADFITIADERFINDARDNGWLDTTIDDLPALSEWPDEYYDAGIATVALSAIGIAYNADLVTDPPTTWEEALSAEFDGRIQNGDPRTVPSYLALMYLLREEYGSDFLTTLADMDTTYEASTVSVNQALAAGAKSLTLTDSYLLVQNLASEGAPLEFRDMSPTTGSIFYGAVSENAQHPNAARLLMNFLLTAEGQETFSADMSSPLGVEAVPNSIPLPEGWREIPSEEIEAARSEVLADLGLE